MAAHPSLPPHAVSAPFNLTCNFPGEVCKSHKQNFNAVKCHLEPVNISFPNEVVLHPSCLKYLEMEHAPVQFTAFCTVSSTGYFTRLKRGSIGFFMCFPPAAGYSCNPTWTHGATFFCELRGRGRPVPPTLPSAFPGFIANPQHFNLLFSCSGLQLSLPP